MGHSHEHNWSGLVSGWDGWTRDRMRIGLVAMLGLAAIATIVAAIAIMIASDDTAVSDGSIDEIGFVTDTVTADVIGRIDRPCSFDETAACRVFEFEVTSGDEAGDVVVLPEFSLEFAQNVPPLSVGDGAVLSYQPDSGTYGYADQERRGSLLALTVLFAVVVVALARWRGVLALVAMAFTVVMLVGFVAPNVLDGSDPVVVCIVAASAIAFVSLFLTHGINPPTAVALVSTLLALLLTLVLSAVFFSLAGFTGLASEEATLLPLLSGDIDLAALLLGGAVLGALGALDDVTVTQVAAVTEIRAQRPDLPWRQVVAGGIRVGRSHIASTVNTLLLAYAGASIPILLLFSASEQSLGIVANSEIVAVEIVRTMCGSIGLVAAVPLATMLAAVVATTSGDGTPDAAEVAPGQPSPSFDDFGPDREFWA